MATQRLFLWGYIGLAQGFALAVGALGASRVLVSLFSGRHTDSAVLIAASVLILASGVASGGVWIWTRRARYREQWWLGEVARRVDATYLLAWADIAQVTRYLPLARPLLARSKRREYQLVSREDWENHNEKFRIIVPCRSGYPIRVERVKSPTD